MSQYADTGATGLEAFIDTLVRIVHSPIWHVIGMGGYLLMGGIIVFFLLVLFRDWRGRGRVEVDCGAHPMQRLLNVLIGISLFSSLVSDLIGKITAAELAHLGFFLPFAGYMLALANGRLQICEHGLWQFTALTRWEQITACHWEGDNLVIETRKGRRQALRLTPVCREAMAAAVQAHCPAPGGEEAR